MIGWDGGRLPMLLAVLEARGGLRLNATDVYLNIAGGLRVSEPAADLAVAAALVSAATDTPTNAGMVYFGEIGLSGEIRQVAQAESRLKEAAKLGLRAGHAAAPGGPRQPPAGPRPMGWSWRKSATSPILLRDLPRIRRSSRMILRLASRRVAADKAAAGYSWRFDDLGRLVVLAVLAVSALLAFMRGLVREVLGLAAWVGAIFAGVWALPRVRPQFQQWLGTSPWVDPVAFAVVFIISLIVLMLISPLDQRAGARPRRSAALTARWVWYSAWRGVRRWSSLPISWRDGVAVDRWPEPVLEAARMTVAYGARSWVVEQLPRRTCHPPPLYAAAAGPRRPPRTRCCTRPRRAGLWADSRSGLGESA